MPRRADHPAERWARRVEAGKIPTGDLVRLACRRHLRDLEEGAARGLRFDRARADYAERFFSFLRHSKGEFAGRQFELSPWQAFNIRTLFGWVREDGTRRYRAAYQQLARKNGKSTLAAGVGLYLFFADGEPGAEVYAAATKRDQARIVHDEAVRMVKASPGLRKHIGITRENLHVERTNSKFEPLGADADTLDGLNLHGAIVDELHAHRTRAVWDVLETATGARRQPLLFAITTAGYDRESVCWELYDYSCKVLDGTIEDDSFFAFVAAIDSTDDWTDERCWVKANPNLNVSVKLDDLRRKAEKAKALPGAQNAFRRLHLNEWTEQADRWLDVAAWDAMPPLDEAALAGRECFGALDLSSTTDLSAFVLVFPLEDGTFGVLPRFWVPAEGMQRRTRRDRVPYELWVRRGFIRATDGNVIDYDVIRADVNELRKRYRIREVAVDRWNSTQLMTQLQGDGLTVFPHGQGFVSMASPTKTLEEVILGERLRHGGHPVLRWMAGNVAVKQDPAGNLKPDKAKSTDRIDGIVALVMALGRAQLRPAPHVYTRRDVVIL